MLVIYQWQYFTLPTAYSDHKWMHMRRDLKARLTKLSKIIIKHVLAFKGVHVSQIEVSHHSTDHDYWLPYTWVPSEVYPD